MANQKNRNLWLISCVAKSFVPCLAEKTVRELGVLMGARGHWEDNGWFHGAFNRIARDISFPRLVHTSSVVCRSHIARSITKLRSINQDKAKSEAILQMLAMKAPPKTSLEDLVIRPDASSLLYLFEAVEDAFNLPPRLKEITTLLRGKRDELVETIEGMESMDCLLYTSPSPRD